MTTVAQLKSDLMKDLRDNRKYKKMPKEELEELAYRLAKKTRAMEDDLMAMGVHYLTAESEAYRETLLHA